MPRYRNRRQCPSLQLLSLFASIVRSLKEIQHDDGEYSGDATGAWTAPNQAIKKNPCRTANRDRNEKNQSGP